MSVVSVSGLEASVTHGSDVSVRSTIVGNLTVVKSVVALSSWVDWSGDGVLSAAELGSESGRKSVASSGVQSDGSGSSVEDEPLLVVLWVVVHGLHEVLVGVPVSSNSHGSLLS